MLKYAIKLKICSNGSNMPKYAFITFAWILLSSKNSSDFDASFDSSHRKNMLLHENPGSNDYYNFSILTEYDQSRNYQLGEGTRRVRAPPALM